MIYPRCARLMSGCAIGCLALWCVDRRAGAVNMFWSVGRGDGSGTFSVADNWISSVPFFPPPPGSNDVAHWGMTTSSLDPKTYTVAFTTSPTNVRAIVEDDRVTFDLNSRLYTLTDASVAMQLGTESGRSGRLTVTDGSLALPFESDVEVGSAAGSSGVLTVGGGGLVLGSPELFVGLNGAGTLNINSNGDVIADNTQIGAAGGGTATITGPGSSLLAQNLSIGSGGTGTLNITNGGRVDSFRGKIADGAGSTGMVTVDGASTWNMSDSLRVGEDGPGTLEIRNGARVTNTEGEIGRGDVGIVTVSGMGSIWTCSDSLNVGQFDAGMLTITDGARVESGSSRIANGTGKDSAVTVDGNSAWMISALLFIGGDGRAGRLDITNGSRVENGQNTISVESVVNVDGVNSEWVIRAIQGIGGKLNITGGAVVRSANVDVIGASAETGLVLVGANSQWIANHLTIRRGATTVRDGGQLETTILGVGDPSGTGVLSIIAGGRAQSSQGSVTDGGTVNVSGSTSQWINSGPFFVSGRLNITGGGRVQDGNASVRSTRPEDAVVVRDPNSVWMHANDLNINNGTLAIMDGGRVEGKDAFVAPGSGDNGMVVVSGPGSVWAIDGRLSIGGNSGAGTVGGTGELRLQAGANVSVTQDTTLFPDDLLRLEGGTLSTSAINFDGAGIFLWTSGTLHVGVFDGSITVPPGGVLAPGGSPGTTTILGDYHQAPGGKTEVEIGGVADGIQHDVVNVTGNALLGGNLELALINGFVPAPANTFTIFQIASEVTGAFANVANGARLATRDGLGSFVVNYGPGSHFNSKLIVLSAFQNGIAGDFDFDGDVDGNDFLVWQRGGSPSPLSTADLAAWRGNFGVPGLSAAGMAVPEPHSEWLAGPLTLFALLSRRRPSFVGDIAKRRGKFVTSFCSLGHAKVPDRRTRWLVLARIGRTVEWCVVPT